MKVFLSHSSKDKEFVRKLGKDLQKLEHDIWFDEWEIKVGDCIVQKVEQGINDSDYIIIVLTPEAVESGWVEREWKVAFGKEVEKKRVIVLPVLLKNCKIPTLLSTKKYADFRENYEIGFVALTQALVTVSNADSNKVESQRFDCKTEISSLLKKIHSKTVPLSQCIAEALPIGIALKNAELIEFCKNELEGWGGKEVKPQPSFRIMPCFVSSVKINMRYFGWDGDTANVISYIESNPDKFKPVNSFQTQPISHLESYEKKAPENKLISWVQKFGDLDKKTKYPDAPIYFYAEGTSCIHLLELIKTELTKKLLSILSMIDVDENGSNSRAVKSN